MSPRSPMGPTQLLAAAGVTVALLAGGVAPAAADSIDISPSTAAPGESVTLTSMCEGPATRLEYTSDAFSGTASAELENASGVATVPVSQDTKPGDYEVIGRCKGGSSTEEVNGTLEVVAAREAPTPNGAPQAGGGGTHDSHPVALLLAGALLTAAVLGGAAYRHAGRRAG